MSDLAHSPVPTRRDRQRQATLDEIVTVSRDLLAKDALSLRSVAQAMGLTAPALYRYVASYQDLLRMVAIGVDAAMTRERLVPARDRHPADDPAARITAAAIAFRAWALSNREEFSVVFANTEIDPACLDEPGLKAELDSGRFFTELLGQIYADYQFPIPALADLDPDLVATLANPIMPFEAGALPEHLRGLLWVFMRSWASLYGTVTLEVFGHLDPRIIASGHLFRQMFVEQARLLGLEKELPRLMPLFDAELRGTTAPPVVE